jgi:DNA polymerase elongation subunit (family B)
MPTDMEVFCKKAYRGGLCDNFKQGEFTDVLALDINSSYPAAMLYNIPVGKSYMITLNRPYSGEPLKEGIYKVIIQQ